MASAFKWPRPKGPGHTAVRGKVDALLQAIRRELFLRKVRVALVLVYSWKDLRGLKEVFEVLDRVVRDTSLAKNDLDRASAISCSG